MNFGGDSVIAKFMLEEADTYNKEMTQPLEKPVRQKLTVEGISMAAKSIKDTFRVGFFSTLSGLTVGNAFAAAYEIASKPFELSKDFWRTPIEPEVPIFIVGLFIGAALAKFVTDNAPKDVVITDEDNLSVSTV